TFPDKDAARSFFQRLRQDFIDWNYCPWESDTFKAGEEKIDSLIKNGK
ncbi:MAG: hypothetical protein GX617_12715, partial [Lentisphaerae bacterium]|nr:hypothetical protein [Lentisphaerota bacterium]